MAVSPFRSIIYRTLAVAVIFVAAALAQAQIAQTGPPARRDKPSAGPRALGIVQLAANGKASLIPVAILVDGKFYDAGSYKASPMPMALEPGTVYEAVRNGESLGLFTVTGVRVADNHTWFADGRWLPAGAVVASKGHKAETKPKMETFDEGPPRLRKGPAKGTPEDTKAAPAQPAPVETKPAPSSSSSAPPTEPAGTPAANAPSAASTPPAAPGPPPAPASAPLPPGDPDHIVLRRGIPKADAGAAVPDATTSAAGPKPSPPAGQVKASTKSPVQIMPAISDAVGPEPRPYTYKTDALEDQIFRAKMLALAADEVRARARALGDLPADSTTAKAAAKPPAVAAAHPRKAGAASASPKTDDIAFDDVQLRVFDLSSSNAPILVLTASARLPQKAFSAPAPDVKYFVTLVTRQDIYADLHKAFSNVTDTRHLDIIPRVDLIDAVDADGDGRGELLFRRVFDRGTAYVIYRQIGDQLWPLFEGTPQ